MFKIYKTSEYFKYSDITFDFINSIGYSDIAESKNTRENNLTILKRIISDLKLNFNLVGIFGSGIGAFYPIVQSLMHGLSVDLNSEVVVLATICASTIIYLEEKKITDFEKQRKLVKDSKTMLEELKLRGVGNGIVKKIIRAFYSIKNIFYIIARHLGAVVGGFIDMLSYTSILIPIMNGVYFIVDKYDLTLDNLIDNFTGLSIGIGTIVAKHAIIDIVDKIKTKFPISKSKIIDEIETPIIQKFGDKTYGPDEQTGDMIKEQ
jgi:hypothetical protein